MDAPAFSPLSEAQVTAIAVTLGRAARWAGRDGVPGSDEVQEIYDAFLEQGITDRDRTITLGVAFGQMLVDRGGLEWVSVKDRHGEEICVAVKGKECFCAPISMIEKRIDRAERLNISQLCADTLDLLDAESRKPGVGPR